MRDLAGILPRADQGPPRSSYPMGPLSLGVPVTAMTFPQLPGLAALATRPEWIGTVPRGSEERLFCESIERASRFPVGPVPVLDVNEQGYLAMSARPRRSPTQRNRAATPWIPNALAVLPMAQVDARAKGGYARGRQRRMRGVAARPAWDESKGKERTEAAPEASSHGHLVRFLAFRRTLTCLWETLDAHIRRGLTFQGKCVVNQDSEAATFQDLGNAPASMAATRSIDCYGCLRGHV